MSAERAVMYLFGSELDGSHQSCVRGDTAFTRKYISEITFKNENRLSFHKFPCFAFVLEHRNNYWKVPVYLCLFLLNSSSGEAISWCRISFQHYDSRLDSCVPGFAPSIYPPVGYNIGFRYVEFQFWNRARESVFLSLNLGDKVGVMTATNMKMEKFSVPEKLG